MLLISNFHHHFNLIVLRCQIPLFSLLPNDFVAASLLGTQISTTTMNIHRHSKYLHSCSKRTYIFLLPMHSQFSAQVGRAETHNTLWKSPSYEGSRTGTHFRSKTAWKADPGNEFKPRLLKLNSEKSLWFILTVLLVYLTEHPTSVLWNLIHWRVETCKNVIQVDTQDSEIQVYQSLETSFQKVH